MIILNEISWLYKKKNTLSLREMYEKCKKRFDNNNNNNKLILVHRISAIGQKQPHVKGFYHANQNDPRRHRCDAPDQQRFRHERHAARRQLHRRHLGRPPGQADLLICFEIRSRTAENIWRRAVRRPLHPRKLVSNLYYDTTARKPLWGPFLFVPISLSL